MESNGAVLTDQHSSASPSRWRRLREVAFGSDSYGLVFLLLVGDYVILTSGWRGTGALVASSAWLGLTVLLAFHTSGVPRRSSMSSVSRLSSASSPLSAWPSRAAIKPTAR